MCKAPINNYHADIAWILARRLATFAAAIEFTSGSTDPLSEQNRPFNTIRKDRSSLQSFPNFTTSPENGKAEATKILPPQDNHDMLSHGGGAVLLFF
jgi:hypothetical protein